MSQVLKLNTRSETQENEKNGFQRQICDICEELRLRFAIRIEESFNVQAMHDILHHRFQLDNYDHLEFPGVVPRTFIGALLVSLVASPIVFIASLLHLPMLYALLIVRMALGCIILYTLRFFRHQIRKKFGHQVEAFFVILTSIQFHFLFYCSRPLPNILALGIVNLAFGY